jgi:hypothetical protein
MFPMGLGGSRNKASGFDLGSNWVRFPADKFPCFDYCAFHLLSVVTALLQARRLVVRQMLISPEHGTGVRRLEDQHSLPVLLETISLSSSVSEHHAVHQGNLCIFAI